MIPAGTLQLTSQGEGIHTLTMTNSTTAGGTIVQYTQGQDEFYVPGEIGKHRDYFIYLFNSTGRMLVYNSSGL